MTAPSIIKDSEAREIAELYAHHSIASAGSPIGRFARTGEITRRFVEIARDPAQREAHEPVSEPLMAYVSHHGERGPQTGHYVVTVSESRPCVHGTQFCVGAACECCEGAGTWLAEVERHPVDTLEEAREAAYLKSRDHTDDNSLPRGTFLLSIGLDGGSVSLPDGAISVERVADWGER